LQQEFIVFGFFWECLLRKEGMSGLTLVSSVIPANITILLFPDIRINYREQRMRGTGLSPFASGYTWDDISYVIGGKYKKARFIDNNGFIITAAKDGSELKTQFNIEDGTWSFYHKGEKKPYNCGKCHTTGYQKEGHQDGKEGLVGTWAQPGVHCEACHGPAGDHIKSNELAKANKMMIQKEMLLCGGCHIRGTRIKYQQVVVLSNTMSSLTNRSADHITKLMMLPALHAMISINRQNSKRVSEFRVHRVMKMQVSPMLHLCMVDLA